MNKKIKIQNSYIGATNKCFIIAEAGSNHNGDLNLAKLLIEKAKECGCDLVKFQIFRTEYLVTEKAKKAQYQEGKSPGNNQFQMLKRLELSLDAHQRIVAHARKVGIPIFYSVFDHLSADAAEKMGIDLYKLGSGELTNTPLIKYIAQKNKPVILSTGMGTDAEIADAIDTVKNTGNREIILMNCSTGYPSLLEDANLRRTKYFSEKFDVLCGNSDHTQGIVVAIMAAALGSPLIEKHFTVDKKLDGPDHSMSLDIREMKELVRVIRFVEKNPVEEADLKEVLRKVGINITQDEINIILGEVNRQLSEREIRQRLWARKSIVAAKDIVKGEILTEELISIKRPEEGILPKYYEQIVSRKAKKLIKEGDPIKWEMLE